jgi:mono/diheme cytochrome c family protein
MKRFRKVLTIGAIALGGTLLLAATVVYGMSESRLRKNYDVVVMTAAVAPDARLIEKGRHLAVTRGCTECHTADLGGQVIMDDLPVAVISASNLTGGAGGVGTRYTEADWDRAIRHGVGANGRALAIMPSKEYFGLSDEDVTALIAYLKSIPPVDRQLPARKMGPLGRTLFVAGLLPPFAAETIDHKALRSAAPPEGETIEYGRYVAMICAGCHGPDLSGGKPSGAPGSPPSSNITPGAAGIGAWTEADFFAAMREGKRPDGTDIQAEFMPWPAFAHMSDSELRALWIYLRSLPEVAGKSK